MTDNEILEELEFRMEEDHDLRFDPREVISVDSDLSIVTRNGWKGVMLDKNVIVPSVYDEVSIIRTNENILILTALSDREGLYTVKTEEGEKLLDCIFDEICISPYHDGVIFKKQGKEGLYSIKYSKIIFEPVYQKISYNTLAKHVWAQKEPAHFIFIDIKTGWSTEVFNSIIPLEHPEISCFLLPDGNIRLLDSDSYELRKLAAANGGRIFFANSRTFKTYISDAHGYILNS